MKEYLNKPFPFIENKKHQLISSLLFGLFIYMFLAVFQPFGISEMTRNKYLYLIGFAFISFAVLIISFMATLRYSKTENWTVRKNIVFVLIQILIISLFNWMYNSALDNEIAVQHNLIYFVLFTFSVGIIPTLFLVHFTEKYLHKQNQKYAVHLTNDIPLKAHKTKDKEIKILSKNKDEEIKMNLEQFICVKSEGNYINVFYKEDDKIKSKLVRNSISNIEEQMVAFNKTRRCHRSFITNFENVDKISGNARNFNLHVDNLDFVIPVSRSFSKATLKELVQ